MLSAFLGFVLMSLHLGLHWGMLMGMVRKAFKLRAYFPRTIILRVIGGMIAVYGLYAFIKNQIGMYMFLRIQFVFFDYEQPPALKNVGEETSRNNVFSF